MKSILSSLLIGASTVSLYASGNGQEDMGQNLGSKTVVRAEEIAAEQVKQPVVDCINFNKLNEDMIIMISSFLPHKDVIALGQFGKFGRKIERVLMEARASKVNPHPNLLGIKTEKDSLYDYTLTVKKLNDELYQIECFNKVLANPFVFAEGMDAFLNCPYSLNRQALAFKKMVMNPEVIIVQNCIDTQNVYFHYRDFDDKEIYLEIDDLEKNQYFVISKKIKPDNYEFEFFVTLNNQSLLNVQSQSMMNIVYKKHPDTLKTYCYASENKISLAFKPRLIQFNHNNPAMVLGLHRNQSNIFNKIYKITPNQDEDKKGLLDIQIQDKSAL